MAHTEREGSLYIDGLCTGLYGQSHSSDSTGWWQSTDKMPDVNKCRVVEHGAAGIMNMTLETMLERD